MDENGKMMKGKHVVAALSVMLLVCAVCCVPVVSVDLFVSDEGVNEAGSTHVQTISFALDQDSVEVNMNFAPQEFIAPGIVIFKDVLRFRGSSRSGTVISGPGNDRLFELTSVQVLFSDLTLRNGHSFDDGGCLSVGTFIQSGNMTLINVLIENCTSTGFGGAVHAMDNFNLYVLNSEFVNNVGDIGGGIYALGGVEIRNTTFRGHVSSLTAAVLVDDDDDDDDDGVGFDTIIDGCYFSNNSASGRTVEDTQSSGTLFVSNSIFGNSSAAGAIRGRNIVIDTVEIREDNNYSGGMILAGLNATVQRTLLAGVADAGISADSVVMVDVVMNAGAVPLAQGRPVNDDMTSFLTVDGVARNDGDCVHLFEINDRSLNRNVTMEGELNSTTSVCGTCESDVLLLGEHPSNGAGVFMGEFTLDGVTAMGSTELEALTYTLTACSSTPLCGSGVFGAVGDVCRHGTLEAELTDCRGVLGGRAMLDGCGDCVPDCGMGEFYAGACGSRACVTECPTDFYFDPTVPDCVQCGGPTSCSTGGFLLECGNGTLTFNERECRCPEGTFDDGAVCVACVHTVDTCDPLGHVFVPCTTTDTRDVSVCTNCTALGMFVRADGLTCTGGCSAGELALAGLPGETTCSPCDADTYQSGLECVACAHDASTCNGDGIALVACGSGEGSDVSSCTNCTAMGMFVAASGATCEGMCPAGERPVVGMMSTCEACEPCPEDHYVSVLCTLTEEHVCSACSGPTSCVSGEVLVGCGAESTDVSMRECVACGADTFEDGGVCVACATNASSCSGDGLAFVAGCGVGESSDTSSCVNCTAMGMFVSGSGGMCTGGCSAGELALAGPSGETTCSPCDADTYQSGLECVACANNASTCNGDGIALVACRSGEGSDVSLCANCTAMGMFVAANGVTCAGGCSAGELALAGPPGETTCSPCGTDTYQSGLECVACAHDASTCNGDGIALVACGSGEGSDVSSCTNCTAMGMFVAASGATCEGGCPTPEVVVPGVAGSMECAPCPVDTYRSGVECVGCASTRVTCSGPELAVGRCGTSQVNDTSTCTNCTVMGLVPSMNGEACVTASSLVGNGGDEENDGDDDGDDDGDGVDLIVIVGVAGIVIGLGIGALAAWHLLKKNMTRKGVSGMTQAWEEEEGEEVSIDVVESNAVSRR